MLVKCFTVDYFTRCLHVFKIFEIIGTLNGGGRVKRGKVRIHVKLPAEGRISS